MPGSESERVVYETFGLTTFSGQQRVMVFTNMSG
jgi:hypothetical protein